jgi:hypothetical protein
VDPVLDALDRLDDYLGRAERLAGITKAEKALSAARALLSANPPQGDTAAFCEHGYTTEDSAHPSAGLERCPTCSPSDGGGVRPADDPHSLVAKAILPDGGGAK